MKRAIFAAAIFFGAVSRGGGEVEPIEDAPLVLRLPSGGEVKVLEIFKTTLIETDEPALVLHYPTSKTKDDLCLEAQEVWAAFKPIVEKEKLLAGVIFQATPSGGGFTWIWKQDDTGVWNTVGEEDKGRTANGLGSADLIAVARRASAIVHLRLIFKPGSVTAPEHPKVHEQVIESVELVRTLKKEDGLLGDAAFREAVSAWRTGGKFSSWSAGPPAGHVDYLVLNELPLNDIAHGRRGGLHLVPTTDGVLRNVERALQSQPAAK